MAIESRGRHPWAVRPVEEARLFNPAFCGELIGRTVVEFHGTCQQSINLTTAFLVLPLVLHQPTRESLPIRASKAYTGWVAEHAALLVELPDRARRLRQISSESVMFAVHHDLLMFSNGELLPGANPVPVRNRILINTDDASAARSAAGLLGRWFARQGTQASILRGMGIAP